MFAVVELYPDALCILLIVELVNSYVIYRIVHTRSSYRMAVIVQPSIEILYHVDSHISLSWSKLAPLQWYPGIFSRYCDVSKSLAAVQRTQKPSSCRPDTALLGRKIRLGISSPHEELDFHRVRPFGLESRVFHTYEKESSPQYA